MSDLPSPVDEGVAISNVTDSPKPFDSSAKADIILRSQDSKMFYVLKSFLCLASPVFDTMFSSWKDQKPNEGDAGMPVIAVEEDSTTLYNLLLLVYPYNQTPSSTIDIWFGMGKAARKYEMDYVDEKIRAYIGASDTLRKEPFRVFAIAMSMGWEDVVKAAAYATLEVPLRDLGWCQELELLRVRDYHQLLQWRLACHDAVGSYLRNPSTTRSGGKAADILQKTLTATGCPRNNALTNDTIRATFLQTNHTTSSSSLYDILNRLAEGIDEALSKVPFDIKCNTRGGSLGA